MTDRYEISRRTLLAGAAAVPLTVQASSAQSPSNAQPRIGNAAGFMGVAEDMLTRAVDAGDQPFGAVVVKNGKIVGWGPSRVVSDTDPTAHAEMVALRDAAKRLGTRDLSGCTMYSTSHPCPMCEGGAYWAGIDRFVYGDARNNGGAPRLRRC